MPSPSAQRSFFRTAARYLTEPHPFARNPVTVRPHPVPWNVYAKKMARTTTFVVPMLGITLGWPLAAQALFEHRM
ncbi:hypothetical protein K458DRAFT_322488 [Lentithecium fluviatile CBS 122367]|uniref:Uncharacterized protein n=1 Tax=Lentithecium fluviatile CBS 122367 TaxID=1168545 RepID=A0A6G1IDI0_9PLEO|nr:hypothetical protein K458DRAFT_322488 [Lentithecium fluviatile CBS 122367]